MVEDLRVEYERKIPAYRDLLVAVESQISSICEKNGIKIHSIRSRLKTFASLQNKIDRKKYTNPWRQCDDIAAVKIGCLFEDQVPQIVAAIQSPQSNLVVVESKKKKKQADQFSYTAHHMIVQHKDQAKFKKDFVCEIQIKTILQDAWSEMEHHVNYKQLSLDEKTQRKVNALAALFEVAEDQFKDIYESFQKLQSLQTYTDADTSDVGVSAAAVYQYAKKEFASSWNYAPDIAQLDAKEEYESIAELAQSKGITTMKEFIGQLQSKLPYILAHDASRSKDILNSPKQWPKLYEKVKATGHFSKPAVILKRCLE